MEIPQLIAKIQNPDDAEGQRWRAKGLAYLVILEVPPLDPAVLGAAIIAAQVEGFEGPIRTWRVES
ncbi:MAG TPA: hypothetical protein VFT46_06190 [Holophagaceae bacterium]|nr:hypothetical protein [Holophagaceae bacterium]